MEDTRSSSGIPRHIGCVGGPGGPTLICVGGLHGNEPPGFLALQRIFARLHADPSGLVGRLVGLAGNRKALSEGERFLTEDLNRMWTAERVALLADGVDPSVPEEEEMRELHEALEAERGACPQARILDLHSTSGEGPAFTTIDDTLANREMGFALPVPHVLGLEEELPATLVGYLNGLGVTAIGFEAGQHLDPTSIDRAEAAVWIMMEVCGVLEEGARAEAREARRLLGGAGVGSGVVEVRYRHPVADGDGFAMNPGFRSFQRIRAGEVLGSDGRGPVASPEDGMILMPLYQDQGGDGFFVIRPVRRMWLSVSAWVRRLRADRVLHWLPGVRRHPEQTGVFLVDRAKARWLALQLFHLLGYRRRSATAPVLEMVRREVF